jgi:hypothetical protein
MEHWAKTIAKNGGIAAVTIQEGADRLRELETEVERLRTRLYKGCDDERDMSIAEGPSHGVCGLASELTARAEKAEAALAIERQALSGVIKLKMHFETECLEQARLLGMSGSREASLLGKISQLERQLEKNNS